MQKWIALAALVTTLGLSGCNLFRPEHRACSRLVELCADGKDAGQRQGQCEEALGKLRNSAGTEAFGRSTSCIADAQSCAAAAGCLVGGIGGGMLNEFFKGVTSSIGK